MKAFRGVVLRLPLVHVAVHNTRVVNLSIIVLDLLQRLAELLAVEVDCSVPAGVNVVSLILLGDSCGLLFLLCNTFLKTNVEVDILITTIGMMDSLSRISFVTFFLPIFFFLKRKFWKVKSRNSLHSAQNETEMTKLLFS